MLQSKRLRVLPVLATLFLALTLRGAESGQALAKFKNVHRIVFLGDSITYAGGYVDDIEAYYDTRFPDQHFEFINLGLSSETVSGLSEEGHAGGKYRRPDLHERLGRVLEKAKPDFTFVCYGMNDGIYQPFDEARFKAFQDGMKSVHEQIAATGAKIIHITPSIFDPAPIPAAKIWHTNGVSGFSHPFVGYNEVLGRYSDWLVGQRAAGWDVVNLHEPMNRWLAEQRQRDSHFEFTKEGVHPDAAGHWFMAKQILLYLGAKDLEGVDSPAAMVAGNPNGAEILRLVRAKQELLRDAWLTYTGHGQPQTKSGVPLPLAEARAGVIDKKIRELAKSNFLLSPPPAAPRPN
ncbi:MAG TPA: SGNH/GDSL hydrolase family protein [Candidatus Angelobacter sp.]|nr:SGNH/GDSL hydrolase family protein [Candidatus Angelobacter sp.]